MEGNIDIVSRKEKNVVVVSVKGRADAVTAPELEKKLTKLIDSGDCQILLNFRDLEYISSAGLRTILAAAKQLKSKDGQIIFAELQGPVKDVFRISGFGSIFQIFESESEALSKF